MKQIYECSKCGSQFQKWEGRCRECGSWGTLQQEVAASTSTKKNDLPQFSALKEDFIVDFSQVKGQAPVRLAVGEREIDRVLGGGLVPGSLILLGGDPGIGKSTLLLAIADLLSKKGQSLFYISGEESAEQVKARVERLGMGASKMKFVSHTGIGAIGATLAKYSPQVAVIDSIQTMSYEEAEGQPGSLTQVRAVTAKLLEIAKQKQITIFIIGHVTKGGQVAGPKTMEHLVDTVLYLEGDKHQQFRILRAVKNRFGSTGEVGIFQMSAKGLQPVKNPSQAFISQRQGKSPGIIHSIVWEGSRSFMVELQALVSASSFGYPKRSCNGLDLKRIEMLIAVLIKRAGTRLGSDDIYINLAGGLKTKDTGLDLAVCLAILSAKKNIALPSIPAAIGEVSLSGEIKPVGNLDKRIREAARLGYKEIFIPQTEIKFTSQQTKLVQISNVEQAAELFFQQKK